MADHPRSSFWVLCMALALSAAGGCRGVEDMKPLEVAIADIHVRDYSGGRAEIEIDLHLTNPNKFEVAIVGVSGDLDVGGYALGPISWSGNQELGGESSTVVRMPRELAVEDRGRLFNELMDDLPLPYVFGAEVQVAGGVVERALNVEATGRLGDVAAGQ